jgi:hypothetical protein
MPKEVSWNRNQRNYLINKRRRMSPEEINVVEAEPRVETSQDDGVVIPIGAAAEQTTRSSAVNRHGR